MRNRQQSRTPPLFGMLGRELREPTSRHHRAACSWPQSPAAGALAQGPLQGRGVGEALGRVLGQAAQHDALQVLGDVGADPRRRHRRVAGVRDQHREPIIPLERRPAGQQVVGHRPQRVEVAPPVHRTAVARRLLRRHEQRRPEHLALPGQPRRAGPRRRQDQAEVEQLGLVLDAPGPRDDDVRRLDVAVDQALGVGQAQGPADLAQEVDRPPRRQGAVPLDELLPGSAPAGTP